MRDWKRAPFNTLSAGTQGWVKVFGISAALTITWGWALVIIAMDGMVTMVIFTSAAGVLTLISLFFGIRGTIREVEDEDFDDDDNDDGNLIPTEGRA